MKVFLVIHACVASFLGLFGSGCAGPARESKSSLPDTKISEWQINSVESNESAMLVATSLGLPGLKVPIEDHSGSVNIVEWRSSPLNSNVWVLIYNVGEVGTSDKVEVTRAAVVDLRDKRILLDNVWKLKQADRTSRNKLYQPEWVWAKTSVRVENTGAIDNTYSEFKP